MKWTEILVPVAIAGMTLVGTVGVETSRAVRLGVFLPHSDTLKTALAADSSAFSAVDKPAVATPAVDKPAVDKPAVAAPASVTPTSATSAVDSVKAQADSLEDDFDIFGEAPKDTTPKIYARDTMKVPDSLKLTDPFLYQWYIAVKDSFTHRTVIDSLKAEGDSLLWPRIDSLYLADSTAVAREKFLKWYSGLSKAERKRYDYEQKLPALLHRQDSILRRKDSLQHIKDSIFENTPRILETSYLPDSLYYKRLVSWKVDRHFNKVEVFPWDTTADYHFYDYPFMRKDVGATWLGMPGSAVQQFDFFQRGTERDVSFYAPLESWTYSPETLPMFNTKMPYTELEYYGNLFNSSTTSSDAFRVFTTQNIMPAFNITLEIKRYGGAGILQNEKTANQTAVVAGNYLGKRYLAHGGFIHNKMTRTENGGVQDNMWIRDTTVDVREISVNLASAANQYKKNTFFFDQSYRIPFSFFRDLIHRKDTTYTPSDTLETDITTLFVGTSSEYSMYSKLYADKISSSDEAGRSFYNGIFNMNPSQSSDSLRTTLLDNRIFVRFQPWKEDAVVSKIEGGVGDRYQTHYILRPGDYIRHSSPVKWNTAYVYAGAEGMIKRYVAWDALGEYNFAGAEVNDFSLKANARLNLYPFRRHKDSPLSIAAHFSQTLKEPSFYEQHFYSNHFNWENAFSKVSNTRIGGSLDIPRWRLYLAANYALVANPVYYDSRGFASQYTDAPVSVISGRVQWNAVLGPVHLENGVLVQYSSAQEVIPLPTVAANLRWFVQFPIVREDVMKMQIGINARYTTSWYTPSFNPVAGVFFNQQEEKYGNCPIFDAFINVQWKNCSVFLKYENAGRGWPLKVHDYFTAHHYIQPAGALKFGISWPFHPMLGKNRTMSERAGSGMGGGGGSGLGGGLGGALGGLKGGLGGGSFGGM